MSDDQSFTGTCPTCGQGYLRADLLRATDLAQRATEAAEKYRAIALEHEKTISILRPSR